MAKSFKDYYAVDKTENKKSKKTVVEQPTVLAGAAEEIPTSPIITPIFTDNTTLFKETLDESKQVFESVTKINEDIATSVKKLVESTNKTNAKLLEAIVALTSKVALLESKLDEIKNIEIPTPIVNLQMPSKTTIKKVHRDGKGFVTHIEESETFDNNESAEE